MHCPECNNLLEVTSCKGVLIHECLSCKGKWFERDELRRVRDAVDEQLRWFDFDPFGEELPRLAVVAPGKACPRCMRKMDALRYHSSQVVINKCSVCRGVWLASGELVKIIGYLEHVVNSQNTGSLASITFKQFIDVLTGPKGTAEEMKDLWALLYILEVRIGVEHPKLADLTRRLYELAPYV